MSQEEELKKEIEEHRKIFVEKEVNRINKSILQEAKDGFFFCPYCGKRTLTLDIEKPFWFECQSCDNAYFLTSKEIFKDMNKELEDYYNKEKEKAQLKGFQEGKSSAREEILKELTNIHQARFTEEQIKFIKSKLKGERK